MDLRSIGIVGHFLGGTMTSAQDQPSRLRNDVFISYAGVNNAKDDDDREGWVTTFVRGLTRRLVESRGRREFVHVWMDQRFEGNCDLSDIITEVKNSATMIVVLSQGYVASDFCAQELECFFETLNGDSHELRRNNRIFIVEIDRMSRDDRPLKLQDRSSYKYWIEDSDSGFVQRLSLREKHRDEYTSLIDRLSQVVAKELRAIGQWPSRVLDPLPPINTSEKPTPRKERPIVMLAEVADDVEPIRESVVVFLDDFGIQVAPDPAIVLPRSEHECIEKVDAELQRSILFVQLLGTLPGKKPPGCKQTYARLQFERARLANKKILQWRDPNMDLDRIQDTEHRRLLEGKTVQAIPIEQFKAAVKREVELIPKSRESSSTSPATIVRIRTGGCDCTLVDQIKSFIKSEGEEVGISMLSSDPDVSAIKHLDGLMFLYCTEEEAEIEARIYRHYRSRHLRQPPVRIGLYQHPPSDRELLNIDFDGVRNIDGRQGLNEQGLRQFIDEVRTRAKACET